MEPVIITTLALGVVAKVLESKLDKSINHEWDSLENLNFEIKKQKVYSGLEQY